MKKLPLLITILVIAVLAGGYFLYDRFLKKTNVSTWDLVPYETILVYETSNCTNCIDQLKSSPVLEIIERATLNPDYADSLKLLRDFILASEQPGRLVSLHVTRKDDFDFTFYTPFTKTLEQQFTMVMAQLQKMKGFRFSEREYNGVTIHEVFFGKRTFSWIELENTLVSSFAPVLIEDVIRTHNTDARSFSEELAAIYQLPRIKNDGGNIFLHLKNFTQWFSLFTTEQPPALIRQFGQSALLDVKISDDNKFVLNGFSLDSVNKSNYVLSAFSGQQPMPFALKQYVSNDAIMFASYGISDGASFTRDLQRINHNPAAKDTLAQLSKALQLDFDKLYKNLKGEIGICWLESKDETSRILIINTERGIEDWLTTFNTLSDKLSIDTVFSEVYSNYEIRELPVYRFPEKFFSPLVSGFDRSFYTVLGNALFIGEDLEDLKEFLDDIDKEDTWGKSVMQNRFLEATLLESNVSLYINTPRVWNVLSHSLQPRWQTFIKENKTLLNALGMGAIQFSHLNDSYYTNVSWSFKPGAANGKPGAVASSDKYLTNFSEGIAKTFMTRSHVDKTDELLVQDSSKNINLISADGKVLWKLPLNDFIVGEVTQIDFFNNGKLQYFFATPGMLHVVDRLGKYVRPYPVAIAEQEVDHVSIVDYDHSKKYRFLVSGKGGKLWMFDKEGKNLEGWQPRIVDERLSAPARHHRILGKDYLIAIRTDGVVYMMNRRGELLRNFPLDLNARPSGDYYLEIGKNRASTYFVVVSRDGFRIKFNLEGKIQSRETLIKNTADAQFSLVREVNAKSYLILRQEPKQLTLFNHDLAEVVSSDFIGNNPADIRYANFGAGRVYITITDLSQELSFVYDGKGMLVSPLPIESHAIFIRPADGEKPKIFYTLQKNLTIRAL